MGFLSGLLDPTSHDSSFSGIADTIQKYTDPVRWIPGVGDAEGNFLNYTLPNATNKIGSKVLTPFDKVDETINPVRQIPIVDKIGDAVRARPGDALGMAAGAYFGGGALAGAGLLGGGAGTTGAAAGGTGFGGSTALGAAPTGLFSGLNPAAASAAGYGGTSFGGGISGAGASGGGVGASGALPIFSGASDGSGAIGQLGVGGNGFDVQTAAQQGAKLIGQQQQGQQGQTQQQVQALQQFMAMTPAQQQAFKFRMPQLQQANRQPAQLAGTGGLLGGQAGQRAF